MKHKLFIAALIMCFALGISAGAESTGEYFFKNNISSETRFIDMYMLGAHDAFTASLSASSPVDDAGVKIGDDGAKTASSSLIWSFGGLKASKAQSAGAEEMLNKGVRFFDVRLSRYQSGGEFFTCHGRISDQFTGEGGVARKISAWAAEHPGEIIVLDFQSLFDIETSDASATAESWKSLASKLEADGIMDYVYTKNGSISSLTYGDLTNEGSRCAIVIFGQVTGANADSRFINRNDSGGYIRSFWAEKSSYEDVQTALDTEVETLKSGSDSYFYKLRVMQAQTTGTNLIDDADKTNIKTISEPDFDEQNDILPVLLVDNATTDAESFNALAVERLARRNREYTKGIYSSSDGNVILTGSNENVPLNTVFSADQTGESLVLSLSGGENITAGMTVYIKSEGKKQRLYKDDDLLGETSDGGWLRAEISSMGEYVLKDTQEDITFVTSRPLLWYSFTGENPFEDKSGNGLDSAEVGTPTVGMGKASLSDGNVLRLPVGLTKNMKSYTVSAWVKMTAQTSGSRLFDIGRKAQASAFAHAGTDKVSSGYKNSNTTTAESGGLSVGQWTHIAASYSGGSLTIYVDGVKKAESYNSDPAPNIINDVFNPNGNYLGRTQWYFIEQNRADNPDINADIADFRIYGQALGSAEIARLAQRPMFKAINIDTGEVIYSESIDVPDAYSGAVTVPIEGFEPVKTVPAEDMAGNADLLAYYRQKESLKAEVSQGQATATVHLNTPREGARLILAVYKDGELVKAVSTPADETDKTVSTEAEAGMTAKAFLWDGNMKPEKLED